MKIWKKYFYTILMILGIIGLYIPVYHVFRPIGQNREPKVFEIIPANENTTSVKMTVEVGKFVYYDDDGNFGPEYSSLNIEKRQCIITFELNNSIYLGLPNNYKEKGLATWRTTHTNLIKPVGSANLIFNVSGSLIGHYFPFNGYFLNTTTSSNGTNFVFVGIFDQLLTQTIREKFVLDMYVITNEFFDRTTLLDLEISFDFNSFYKYDVDIIEHTGTINHFTGHSITDFNGKLFVDQIFGQQHYSIPAIIKFSTESSRFWTFIGGTLIGLAIPIPVTVYNRIRKLWKKESQTNTQPIEEDSSNNNDNVDANEEGDSH